MILQALYDYYHRCGDLPQKGMELKEIGFLIVIDKEGHFLRFEDRRIDKKQAQTIIFYRLFYILYTCQMLHPCLRPKTYSLHSDCLCFTNSMASLPVKCTMSKRIISIREKPLSISFCRLSSSFGL